MLIDGNGPQETFTGQSFSAPQLPETSRSDGAQHFEISRSAILQRTEGKFHTSDPACYKSLLAIALSERALIYG
ncbi:hypothetical protein ACFQFQ_30405 [Sulfitobacter porphyrae]|uniref:Uncharacterized protein n=1 Tax=Sulfitobacter porphyrae TaxID=1246864 RepID=A0ABW2BBN0_9RHOB